MSNTVNARVLGIITFYDTAEWSSVASWPGLTGVLVCAPGSCHEATLFWNRSGFLVFGL